MEVLALNGLGAADRCKNTVKFPLTGIALFNSIGGTLPACIWQLRNLTTLHVSSNGLTGEISSVLPLHSPLKDLSLSHNKFSGNFPLGVIQHVPKTDLSYNKLSGKYSDYEGLERSTTKLHLEINRLSGNLPASKLENVTDLNILRGNKFSCQSIPQNDEEMPDYSCGSSRLNEALTVFGSVLLLSGCLAFSALVIIFSSRFVSSEERASSVLRRQVNQMMLYMTYLEDFKSDNSRLHRLFVLRNKFQKNIWLFLRMALVILLLSVPIFIIRGGDDNNEFSTHTNTYSWFWTLAFLHGLVPCCLIMGLWTIAIVAYFYSILLGPLLDRVTSGRKKSMSQDSAITPIVFDEDGEEAEEEAEMNGKICSMSFLLSRGFMVVLMVANVAVTVVVNVLYIYSTQQPLTGLSRRAIQISLAVFRMAYSFTVFPFLARSITDPVENVTFRLRLLIASNLVIPCIATAFTSPACFQVYIT